MTPSWLERLREVFRMTIGDENIGDAEPSMGGEDFSRYGRAGVPILMYRLGTVAPERLQRFRELGIPPPALHSGLYYPDPEPSLRSGILTLSAAALELMSHTHSTSSRSCSRNHRVDSVVGSHAREPLSIT